MKAQVRTQLNTREQQATEALIERLFAEYGDRVVQLVLFGSKARGDDTRDSDIDVLVVTTSEDWPLKHDILTLGSRLSLDYDVLFNLYVISHERWAWMQKVRHPLYRNIMADGVDFTPEPAEA